MQPSEPVSPTRWSSRGAAAASGAAIALPLLVLLAVFLGGATQRWAVGLIIGCFSLFLLARPPRFSLGPALNTIALFFLALAGAAFLPAHWFLVPQWRVALTKDFGIHLASTVTVQPWMTLDSLAVLVAGLAWIYYVATLDAHLRDIRLAARTFAAGIIALAGLSIYLHLRHSALPFWHNERGFGPFPNRNQTGDLFGISTIVVLGCMQDDFRRGHKRWILWLPGVGLLITALVLAFSRAGILILVLGLTAWLVRLAFRKWSIGGVAIALSTLLALLAGLLVFGGETIDRFNLRFGSGSALVSDYRWLIFQDTWTMIRASPWCGVGLGNFEGVFALFRNVSRGITRSLHPESDWLWVAAEMGWPALALILAGTVIFVRRAFPLHEGTNQRLRYAALVGGLFFLLHGFVDVSAHRLGTFLAGTLLLGLAQFRPLSSPPCRWSPILFRVVGLFLAVVSLAWLIGWRSALPMPGRLGVENAKQAAAVANRGHRFAEAISLADRGLEWAPLDWQLYFLRAVARIGARESPALALDDFRRARFLEPNAYQLPFEEGKAWLGWQSTLAITAWREALQRRGAEEAGIYALMLTDAANYDPKVHAALREFAINRPRLTINYLEAATQPQFEEALHDLLASDAELRQFTPEQKTRLFALWSNHDPLDELLRAVQTHPEWVEFAWPGIARYNADRHEFEDAWQLVRRYAPPPDLPRSATGESIPELKQDLYANPDDYAAGYALYRAQFDSGKIDDALATARHFTARPGVPAYFHYLEAEAWAGKQDWEHAWQSWQGYKLATEN